MVDHLPDKATTPGPTDPSDPLINRVLDGRFRILSLIATGGMGRVYRGEQTSLDRQVAIKVLSTSSLTEHHDPSFKERFIREARTSSRLHHANTVTTLDYGKTEDGIYYIVMEYVEGVTLSRRLRAEMHLNARTTLGISRQICRSLREAHGFNIIHRDLKPANILLVPQKDEEDVVKVFDFGVAKIVGDGADAALDEKITRLGTFVGTPEYAAPEAAFGRADKRSDIYSVGVLMYRMLAGRVPFKGHTETMSLMMAINDPVPAFDPALLVPPRLVSVVMRCLEKDPDSRFQSIEELIRSMDACLVEMGAEPPSVAVPAITAAVAQAPVGSDKETLAEPLGALFEDLAGPAGAGSSPSLAIPLAAVESLLPRDEAQVGGQLEAEAKLEPAAPVPQPVPRSRARGLYFATLALFAVVGLGSLLIWALGARDDGSSAASTRGEGPETGGPQAPPVAGSGSNPAPIDSAAAPVTGSGSNPAPIDSAAAPVAGSGSNPAPINSAAAPVAGASAATQGASTPGVASTPPGVSDGGSATPGSGATTSAAQPVTPAAGTSKPGGETSGSSPESRNASHRPRSGHPPESSASPAASSSRPPAPASQPESPASTRRPAAKGEPAATSGPGQEPAPSAGTSTDGAAVPNGYKPSPY